MPTWDDSCLNKRNANCTGTEYSLNDTSNSFITSINFADKIASVKWHCYQSKTEPAASTELANTNLCTNTQKVGLMYLSDYLLSYDNGTNNASNTYKGWLYPLNDEWTISSYGYSNNSASSYYWSAWEVHDSVKEVVVSFIESLSGTLYSAEYGVRPVFYLNSSVVYSSGTGTIENPIRIQ